MRKATSGRPEPQPKPKQERQRPKPKPKRAGDDHGGRRNLAPSFAELQRTDPERAREIHAMGGRASGPAKRRRKAMRQLASEMMSADVSPRQAKVLAAQYGLTDEDATVAAAMVAGQITQAVKGSTKAFEALREMDEAERARKAERQAWHVDARDLTADFVEPYRCAHEYFEGGRPGLHTMVLRGGRGGAKSSFAARLAYECMRQDASANVVFARRFKSDLRSTVFAQFRQVLGAGGDASEWDVRTSPPKAIYRPTGTAAYFVGLDNPELLKSFVPDKGYVKLLVFEEADELGLREMESAADTMMRANGIEDARQLQVRVFNPPPSASNPMNEWCTEHAQDPGVEVYESSYLHVPRQWLGEQFFERASWFAEHQPEYYRNNYLGEVTGTGGEIFANVRDVELSDEAVTQMDESGATYQGLDFGYEHPMAFVRVHYDRETRTVTPTYEQVQRHASMGDFLRSVEAWRGQEVICDSAEPDRIADMREAGWDAVGAVKRWGTGKGRAYSWDWLRQRYRIMVDGRRTPELAHELRTLEFARTKDGHYSSRYPDVGEDAVMALIYALNRVIRDEE